MEGSTTSVPAGQKQKDENTGQMPNISPSVVAAIVNLLVVVETLPGSAAFSSSSYQTVPHPTRQQPHPIQQQPTMIKKNKHTSMEPVDGDGVLLFVVDISKQRTRTNRRPHSAIVTQGACHSRWCGNPFPEGTTTTIVTTSTQD